MRQANLVGVRHGKRRRLTKRDSTKTASPDLVERQFTAASPDHRWVADITQHPTAEGWLYLAVVIDIFSRKVVGWAMSERLYAELVVNALDMALKNRRPAAGLIHRSDQRAGPGGAALPKTRLAVHFFCLREEAPASGYPRLNGFRG